MLICCCLARPGSFKSAALYLLAFDPVQRTLNVASTIDAYGPHQYLATNAARDRLYATTWASPPILSSWAVELQTDSRSSSSPSSDPAILQAPPKLSHLNNADICRLILPLKVSANRKACLTLLPSCFRSHQLPRPLTSPSRTLPYTQQEALLQSYTVSDQMVDLGRRYSSFSMSQMPK